MMELLSQLPAATPAAPDADRIRHRCHAALSRREPARRSLVDGVVLAAAAVYLFSAVIQLVALFGPSAP